MKVKKALCVMMVITMLFALTACKSGGGEVKELTVTLNGRKNVSVNGITHGSSKSDVKNAIGSPTETEIIQKSEYWIYLKGGKAKGERYLLIMFDKNDKVSDLEVDLELL